MRKHMLGMLALISVTACTRPGGEFVGRWTPVTTPVGFVHQSLVGDATMEIRRDGKRFYVTMDGSAVPAHLTQDGQLKIDGLIPLELSYSKEKDSVYMMGVQLQRLDE